MSEFMGLTSAQWGILGWLLAVIGWILFFSMASYGGWKLRFIKNFVSQEHVDQVLCKFAKELDNACKNQVELQQELKGDIDYIDGYCKRVVDEIARRKKIFWENWETVKQNKFSVRNSYKDYLHEHGMS